jgi:hypothetical protein
MTETISTAKTTMPAKHKKSVAVRKPPVKRTPVTKITAPTAKVPKTPADQGKKPKKEKSSSSKVKVIRDSFTMPKNDYAKIGELKQLCMQDGLHVKKSELLRAGLHALGKLSAAQLKTALAGLEKIETGRPKKN